MLKRKPSGGWFVSIQVKVVLILWLLFTIAFALLYYQFFELTTRSAHERIVADLALTLQGAAEGVDVAMVQALAAEGQPRADGYTDDPRYWEHVAWLNKVQQVEPRSKAYTYVLGDEPYEVVFIGSGGALESPTFGAKFKERYVSDGPLYYSFNGQIMETEIYTDEWGSWISGYMPLTDDQGRVVAAIGVDFQAGSVVAAQEAVRRTILPILLASYIAALVLVVLVARLLTRPLLRLTNVAEHSRDGNYDTSLTPLYAGRQRDEISTLAQAFDEMIAKVREREQNLKKRVAELQIEIDLTKQERQVAEITDTDYFRELERKASSLRRSSRKMEPGTNGAA